MKIVIDSREQLAYEFPNQATKVAVLPCGDYSLEGGEHLVAIERKTIGDVIACLTTGRERFERELHRGKALEYFCLVLECSLGELVNGRYHSKMNPNSAMQSLLAFSIRYRLPVFFCENRQYGQRITESVLLKYAREAEKQYKTII